MVGALVVGLEVAGDFTAGVVAVVAVSKAAAAFLVVGESDAFVGLCDAAAG